MRETLKLVIEKRLNEFRKKLNNKKCDGALICKRENYMYISGFTGTSAYIVVTMDEAFLLTDFRYVKQAKLQAPLFKVIKYQGDLIPALNDLLKQTRLEVLGFEESYVTYQMYKKYRDKLEVSKLVPLEGITEELRLTKDEVEVEKIKKAVEIADSAFMHITGFLKPGVREIEVAAELEYFMKKQGASGPSFETIVASGQRSAMPHGVASEKKIQKGDTVTMDYGAVYDGYCSDMTRTVFIGQPDEEMRKIYDVVLKAQLEALEGAWAGLTGKEIDSIARDYISKAGYDDYFGHGLGHGVGLEIHEKPRLSPLGSEEIKNGMVVTIEPGIYLEGIGGVRIEDMIVVNDKKPIKLTSSTKDIIVL